RSAFNSRGYAVSVRRAPAAAAMTTPPITPTISASDTTAPIRARSSERARIQTAFTSLTPQHDGWTDATRDASRKECNEICECDRRGDHDEDEDRHDRLGDDPEAIREEAPSPSPRHDTEGHAHDEGDEGEGRGLPRNGCRDLSPDEAERLQDGQVPPPPADRVDQGVREREDGGEDQQTAEHERHR